MQAGGDIFLASRSFISVERKYWLQTKARGKRRFIWREMLGSLLIWLIVVLGVEAIGDGHHLLIAVQSDLLIGFILLPITLVGGYLTGSWRWKDLEKKYPEDSLPPGE
jgi:hypothetical protein